MKIPDSIYLLIRIGIGVVLGIVVGLAFGFYGLIFGGSLILGRDFMQWGWIFLFFTIPGGASLGGLLGGLTIATRPRLFVVTFLPLATFLIAEQIIDTTLTRMDRPRTFALEVVGTEGAQYAGIVCIDGKTQKLRGKLPGEFVFEGFRLETAFVLVNPKGEERIAVKTYANGRNLDTSHDTQTGVYLDLKSFGYSETHGGTSSTWSRMSSEEVDALVQYDKMPMGLVSTWEPKPKTPLPEPAAEN